jgi:hypothetical protein
MFTKRKGSHISSLISCRVPGKTFDVYSETEDEPMSNYEVAWTQFPCDTHTLAVDVNSSTDTTQGELFIRRPKLGAIENSNGTRHCELVLSRASGAKYYFWLAAKTTSAFLTVVKQTNFTFPSQTQPWRKGYPRNLYEKLHPREYFRYSIVSLQKWCFMEVITLIEGYEPSTGKSCIH